MDHELSYIVPLKRFAEGWIDGNKKWVQLYPYDSWDHPFYGTTTIDPQVANKFVENFDSNIRGQEIHSAYEHGLDPAKGAKASGKFLQVEARDDGPWALVEFTNEAKKEIDEGEWNYWSTEHYDSWTHPHTKEIHESVLAGGCLTNKPFVKDMVPLNFSELMLADPTLKMHSMLSGADRDKLPDSAFAYIEPGGQKDAEGKTVPRSMRHLPYKMADGSVDLPHVRNALARLSGTQIPDSVKPGIMGMLHHHLVKQYSETASGVLDILETLPVEQFIVDNDPFFDTTTEPVIDPVIEPTSTNEEGMDELLKKFSEMFGLGEDADEEAILKYASDMQTDIVPLRELQKSSEQKRSFSERYPVEAKELEDARIYRQEQEAKKFTESLAGKRVTKKVSGDGDEVIETPTGLGLSALAIDTAGEMVKKFSEGNATVDDFRQFTESLYDNGIVDYGTHGSSREDETDDDADVTKFKDSDSPQDIRKKFNERILILAKDEFEGDTLKAYAEAGKRWPIEFAEYRNRKPGAVTI